jgi:hypothetical protein
MGLGSFLTAARQKATKVTRTQTALRRQDQSPFTITDAGASGQALPIGSVYISVLPTNPAVTLGYGVWQYFGAGRVIVGVDPTQAEFTPAFATGGEKVHVLTVDEDPR